MRIAVLASGSRGNSIYIEDGSGALLVDAGLAARETLKRLGAAGGDPDKVQGVLVTHEHQDHVLGLDSLSSKLGVTVFGTHGTLHGWRMSRKRTKRETDIHALHYLERHVIGDFTIEPFPTFHDAAEPCGYLIASGDTRLAVCTDTGNLSPGITGIFRRCDGLVLESNHCPDMLATGPYPEVLKRRIRSGKGHLSNQKTASCLKDLGGNVGKVMLAHLSEVNNTPHKAFATARDGLGLYVDDVMITVASQLGPLSPAGRQEMII